MTIIIWLSAFNIISWHRYVGPERSPPFIPYLVHDEYLLEFWFLEYSIDIYLKTTCYQIIDFFFTTRGGVFRGDTNFSFPYLFYCKLFTE